MNVLIVDDNDNCLQLMRRVLESLPDAKITAAFGGCEAWWHLSDPQKSFDLMIADVSMPVVGGLALTRRIRATPDLQDLRIILCSAMNDRKTVEELLHLGVTNYVVKPYGVSTMLDKIHLAMATVP